MLTFAFETLGVVRAALVTDVCTQRAQGAVERLGATQEGALRKHRRRSDGSWRDTVIYAITDDDRPQVKNSLQRRLHSHPSAGRERSR